MKYYLAIDIGASSGRHIMGWDDCGEIKTDEVYRFSNFVNSENGHLVWDTARLFEEVKNGIKEAFKKYPSIESVAIDTWGVDYVLMNNTNEILPCYAYRDSRTDGAIDAVHKILPFEKLYEHTGIQFQGFNTIYQLYGDLGCGRLCEATDFLMMPEYLTYKLTGSKLKEYTNASTTGLVNARTKTFDSDIVSRLGLPARLFGNLSMPGTSAGMLLPEIAEYVGGQTQVKLCASHDTASAFESIDTGSDSLILSSGTWSLIGAKIDVAITSKDSLTANFTNEGGVGYIRFLKNIMGLWIIGELKKEFDLDFTHMIQLAKDCRYKNIFNVNAEDFLAPSVMSKAIINWFEKNNQTAPVTINEILNSVYHSLASSYKDAVKEIELITNKKYQTIYIVGGGAKNVYLNDLAAEYTGKSVIALPIEATAIGNLKTQMRIKE